MEKLLLIIDALTDGFYYKRSYLEVVGQGTDYIPLWDKTHKILTVHENAELVYDSSETPNTLGVFNYLITKDKSAIIQMNTNSLMLPNPIL